MIDFLEIKFNDILEGKEFFEGPYLYLKNKNANIFIVKAYRILKGFGRSLHGEDIFNGKFEIEINNFNKFIPEYNNRPYNYKITKNIEKIPNISYIFQRIFNILSIIFTSYEFLGPIREEPSRRYIYEDEILEIGSKGENAAFLYLKDGNRILDEYVIYDKNLNSFQKIKKKATLKEVISKWLEIMNIKNINVFPQREIIYLNLASDNAKNLEVNIADTGFGVSQIFPIILEGIRLPKGSTLILEQPEIHLHPSMQAQMADFFIALALSRKNLIIETHSEHIINRLVRRIIEDTSNNLINLINIFFIKSSLNGAKYEKILIDDKKGILNWPEGFLDQSILDTQKILEASSKKLKNSEIKKK